MGIVQRDCGGRKKWLGEDTQQYRPKKRCREPDWYCSQHGHKFVDGSCEHCGDPEIDEVAAVECDYCRVIFGHTGRKHCPIHEGAEMLALPLDLSSTEMAEQSRLDFCL